MKCPVCDAVMREVERRGVRIDVCPECKGVWLDRGELDKLIVASREDMDQAASRYAEYSPPPGERVPPRPSDFPRREPDYRGYEPGYRGYEPGYRDPYYGYPKKKKKRFLEEIFDIFD